MTWFNFSLKCVNSLSCCSLFFRPASCACAQCESLRAASVTLFWLFTVSHQTQRPWCFRRSLEHRSRLKKPFAHSLLFLSRSVLLKWWSWNAPGWRKQGLYIEDRMFLCHHSVADVLSSGPECTSWRCLRTAEVEQYFFTPQICSAAVAVTAESFAHCHGLLVEKWEGKRVSRCYLFWN